MCIDKSNKHALMFCACCVYASLRRLISLYPDKRSPPLIHSLHTAHLYQSAVQWILSVTLPHTPHHSHEQTAQMVKRSFSGSKLIKE